MGNSVAAYERPDTHKMASLEKELPFLTVSQNPRKKKGLIFHSGTWKRIVESTRKSRTRIKINPSQSCPDGGFHQMKCGEESKKQEKCEYGDKEKSQPSYYLINTKEVPSTTESKTTAVISHLQPQPLHDDSLTSNKSRNGVVSDHNRSNKQIEAFSSKPTYTRLYNNNIEKIPAADIRNREKIPSYQEAVKRDVPQQKQRIAPSAGSSGKKFVVQASTTELLECLGHYVCKKCKHIPELYPDLVSNWIRGVDRSLLMQGWQDISFIMPSSIVFVYMLCREMMNENFTTVYEVQATVLTCLYMSYSYMGNEISYPLRPFLIENNRYQFWERCCVMMNKCHDKMLRINKETQYFTTIFRDLISNGSASVANRCVRPAAPRAPLQVRPQIHSPIYMQHPYHSSDRREGYKVTMTAGAN